MGVDRYNRFESFKVLAHAEKIREITRGDIPAPVEWVIYPSNICGYRCPHCIMAKEQIDHRDMFDEKTMDKIPEDVKKHGIKCVIFSGGGDPLLNRFTLRTARAIKGMGVSVGINNQGYLLDDPTPFNFVRYSVDAAKKETYERIHNVDGWDRVNRNIARHAELRAQGEKIEMGLAFLVTPWNWTEVYEFCEWGSRFNPDFIHIRPAYLDADYMQKEYPDGGVKVKEKIMPNLAETAKAIQRDFKNVYFRADKFEGFWTPKAYAKCRATPLMAVTSGDGAFLVCQDRGIMAEENYLRWGDYNRQSFAEIWWSEEHRKVLEKIDLPKCPRCVENAYNEIIEHCFIDDKMRMSLL